mmetsp:Transcript_2064/g.5798  ORF Transcript_2064/g.5798 Transcript_2064/m.5798 type:complete len:210 (+) Transcript_2064:492-1121(+)
MLSSWTTVRITAETCCAHARGSRWCTWSEAAACVQPRWGKCLRGWQIACTPRAVRRPTRAGETRMARTKGTTTPSPHRARGRMGQCPQCVDRGRLRFKHGGLTRYWSNLLHLHQQLNLAMERQGLHVELEPAAPRSGRAPLTDFPSRLPSSKLLVRRKRRRVESVVACIRAPPWHLIISGLSGVDPECRGLQHVPHPSLRRMCKRRRGV